MFILLGVSTWDRRSAVKAQQTAAHEIEMTAQKRINSQVAHRGRLLSVVKRLDHERRKTSERRFKARALLPFLFTGILRLDSPSAALKSKCSISGHVLLNALSGCPCDESAGRRRAPLTRAGWRRPHRDSLLSLLLLTSSIARNAYPELEIELWL